MTDHRRMQRTLFRMQFDPAFAERLRAREPDAVRSTGLGDDDLAHVIAAAPEGVAADFRGRRRAQFLANVAGELAASAWLAVQGGVDAELVESFTKSRHFHDAIVRDERLPVAFARHGLERAHSAGSEVLIAFATLESALVAARREAAAREAPPPDGVVLAAGCHLVTVPAGTFERLQLVRQLVDAGGGSVAEARDVAARVRRPFVAGSDESEVLLLRSPLERPRHGLAPVEVEAVHGLTRRLLQLVERPSPAEDLAAFCAENAVEREELESFVDDLVADEILVRGR